MAEGTSSVLSQAEEIRQSIKPVKMRLRLVVESSLKNEVPTFNPRADIQDSIGLFEQAEIILREQEARISSPLAQLSALIQHWEGLRAQIGEGDSNNGTVFDAMVNEALSEPDNFDTVLKDANEALRVINHRIRECKENCERLKLMLPPVQRAQIPVQTPLIPFHSLNIAQASNAIPFNPQPVIHGPMGSQMQFSHHRLPKLELQKFDGDFHQYMSWWDSFESAIDSKQDIPPVNKMVYLMNSLTGDALLAVRGLRQTALNYPIALRTLKDRFGDPKIIIDCLYKELRLMPRAENNSKSLRKIFTRADCVLRQLESHKQDIGKEHTVMTLLTEKFPKKFLCKVYSRKKRGEAWALNKLRNELQTEIELFEEIERIAEFSVPDRASSSDGDEDDYYDETAGPADPRAKNEKEEEENYHAYSANAAASSTSPPQHKDNQSYNPAQRKTLCRLCYSEWHAAVNCTQYRTIEQREEAIAEFELCSRCLRDDHPTENCPSKFQCRFCDSHDTAPHHGCICPANPANIMAECDA